MFSLFFRGLGLGLAVMAWGVSSPVSAATLREALDHAWSNQAQSARLAQFDAQMAASQAWLPNPPALSLSGRSDQIDARQGAREWEAEISFPLWLWGQREQTQIVARSEQEAGIGRFAQERWQLAGELREAWWEVRLAEAELEAAQLKLGESWQLESDVQRRVASGDLAPLDLNQARASVAQARLEALRAQTALQISRQQFNALAKGAAVPDQPETLTQVSADGLDAHPALTSLGAAAVAAQARLGLAGKDTRDAPEVGLTLTRERGQHGEPYQNLARLSLKIPFGSAARNQPRITAANAELAEAQLLFEQMQRKQAAAIATAQAELAQSRQAVEIQQENLQIAEQSFAWVDKAFRAGQLDLPARLRAESDLVSARLSVTRARLESSRAVSRYNQAVGVLP